MADELLAPARCDQRTSTSGDCDDDDDRAAQVQARIQALPADGDPEVKTELLERCRRNSSRSSVRRSAGGMRAIGATGGADDEPSRRRRADEPTAEAPADDYG